MDIFVGIEEGTFDFKSEGDWLRDALFVGASLGALLGKKLPEGISLGTAVGRFVVGD